MNRKTKINQLKKKGLSYQEIGNKIGVSKQRIHQIIKNYQSPSSFSPTTRIPPSWNPNGEYDTRGIKLEGRDFLKEVIRRRDNYTCQTCGRVWKKGERRLDVHHLDEDLEGENGLKYENCKCFDRMITLCHKCHLRLDNIKRKMSITQYKRWNRQGCE